MDNLKAYLETIPNRHTRDAAHRDLEAFFHWWPSHTLRDFKPRQLSRYRNHLAQTKAPATVNRHLSSIKGYLRWLVEQEQLPAEVYAGALAIKGVKQEQRLPRILSEDELEQLLCQPDLSTVVGVRDLALLCVLIYTGVRVSEALGLNVEDVSVGRRTLRVYGKGGKERVVHFNEATAGALLQYLATVGSPKSGPLFVGDARRLSVRQTQRLVAEYGARIGREVHPHLLRHSFATLYLERSNDLDAVQRQLGHARPEMTQRYTRLAVGRLGGIYQRAMERPAQLELPAEKVALER